MPQVERIFRDAFSQSVHAHRSQKAFECGRNDRDEHDYDEAMFDMPYRRSYADGWNERDKEILGGFVTQLWR